VLSNVLSTATPVRTRLEHIRLAKEYSILETAVERAKFAKIHGVRWTEFARLHYFDPVRMVIIDPMHCILLGALAMLVLYYYSSHS
jgi:hypothetical protein